MVTRESGKVLRYGLPGLILGLLVSSNWGAGGPPALAQGRPPADFGGQAIGRAGVAPARPATGGESNGTLAFVTNPGGATQWLYLVDTKSQAFAVYRLDPGSPKGALKLESARQYKWDLKLEHYNNQAPEPAAIESTVRSLAQSVRTGGDR